MPHFHPYRVYCSLRLLPTSFVAVVSAVQSTISTTDRDCEQTKGICFTLWVACSVVSSLITSSHHEYFIFYKVVRYPNKPDEGWHWPAQISLKSKFSRCFISRVIVCLTFINIFLSLLTDQDLLWSDALQHLQRFKTSTSLYGSVIIDWKMALTLRNIMYCPLPTSASKALTSPWSPDIYHTALPTLQINHAFFAHLLQFVIVRS